MKELVLSKGFIRTGGCNCGGTRTDFYEKPDKPQFRIELKSSSFSIKKFDVMWKTASSGGQDIFETVLNHYLN